MQMKPPSRPAEPAPDELPPLSRRERYEVLVFLLLIIPSYVLSPFAGDQRSGFPLTAFSVIANDLAVVALLR